ncbi:MAG TPA: heme NO-binding domain-containing protein [Vicinamibacteria bacterium]|nr:heme NO-binding domain-containing protein [Vicinamibacteria bacterium]
MHGLIFLELKKFVDARLGEDAWRDLLRRAGLEGREYLPVQEHPEAEAMALMAEVGARTGLDEDALLQLLGEFMAPDLLRMYGSLLRREWKTLDVVEHTESTIHRVMRARNPDAGGIAMRVERRGPDEVLLTYGSARRMCGLAKGIVRGLAGHFHERVRMTEPACMHQGAPECRIRIERF